MIAFVVPIVFALVVWWFSTGLVLLLDRRSPSSYGNTMVGATVVLALALAIAFAIRGTTGEVAAYTGFLCGIAVWAWTEISFLLGYVTGPVKTECPKGLRGFTRLAKAIGTIVYHELAILALGCALALLTWGAENQVALWTYSVLWIMRLSAKLNIYFGVANFAENFLPSHLKHLTSYVGARPISVFFGVSVTFGTVAAAMMFHAAHGSAFEIAGAMLVGTIMALALVEHWLMVLPIKDTILWSWALGPNAASEAVAPEPAGWATKRVGG